MAFSSATGSENCLMNGSISELAEQDPRKSMSPARPSGSRNLLGIVGTLLHGKAQGVSSGKGMGSVDLHLRSSATLLGQQVA